MFFEIGLIRSFLGFYNHFCVFSFIRNYYYYFFNLLNFYPVTRFLVTPLLVSLPRYSV